VKEGMVREMANLQHGTNGFSAEDFFARKKSNGFGRV
jgi:hypothetical protein